MMEVNEWMLASAEFMAKDRPDVFIDTADALNILADWKNSLDSTGSVSVSSAGFELTKFTEDEGIVEYRLSRVLSSVTTFQPEAEAQVFNWTTKSKALAFGVDLPNLD